MLVPALAAFVLISAVAPPLETPLWEAPPPGAPAKETPPRLERRGSAERPDGWLTGVERPVLSVYRPSGSVAANGAAIVVCPGGGYAGQAIDKEGHFVARWLVDRGFVAVVLPYRCGSDASRHPAPLEDAQRALRYVRAHSEQWGVDPNRVGVMGFSAGGHLAATVATIGADADPEAADPIERRSGRPDFCVLVYPVITLVGDEAHRGSARNLLGDDATEAQRLELSADRNVDQRTPPTLLVHAEDDRGVPAENSRLFYRSCVEHGVEAELHLYPRGGHGFGMWAGPDWMAPLEAWLRKR